MRTNRLLLTLTLAVISLISIGCSSGGGDSAPPPTDPTTEFSLFAPGAFTAGYTFSMNLSGSDSAGGTYTGIMATQTQAQSTFLGQDAIPALLQLQLTNTTTGASINSTTTGYYSTLASDRHYLGSSDSTQTTVSALTTAIPETAKIGQLGIIGTYTYNTGDVQEQSWRLDDGGNGLAKYVVQSTFKDQFGSLLQTTTTTATIDSTGVSHGGQIVIFDAPSGITITLNGS